MPDVVGALRLAVKVLNKTMDGTAASPDKIELFVLTLDDDKETIHHKILTKDETKKIIDQVSADDVAGAGES